MRTTLTIQLFTLHPYCTQMIGEEVKSILHFLWYNHNIMPSFQ